MILKELSPTVLGSVAEFIRKFDASRDFAFWGETLIPEEMKELQEAHDKVEGVGQVLKESADLIYVLAGFYNVMPKSIYEVIDNDRAVAIVKTLHEAEALLGWISMNYKIPIQMFEKAFFLVHESNLSKLDETGHPIRREDGKILKGPNYQPPNMAALVNEYTAMLEEAL